MHGSTRVRTGSGGTLRMGWVCARSPLGIARPSRAHCCRSLSLRNSGCRHAVHHDAAAQEQIAERHVDPQSSLSVPHHATRAYMRPVGVTGAVGWPAEQARKYSGVPHSVELAIGEVDGRVEVSGGTAAGRGRLLKIFAQLEYEGRVRCQWAALLQHCMRRETSFVVSRTSPT